MYRYVFNYSSVLLLVNTNMNIYIYMLVKTRLEKERSWYGIISNLEISRTCFEIDDSEGYSLFTWKNDVSEQLSLSSLLSSRRYHAISRRDRVGKISFS